MAVPLLVFMLVGHGLVAPQTVIKTVQSTGNQTAATQSAKVQNPVEQTGTAPAPQPFANTFVVVEPNRIALTPKVDGTIEDEEWDPISTSADLKSYFQWEPGKLHIAGQVPAGHDLVASFDLKSNGWLIGKDNLEVRISEVDGKAALTCRIVDGTGISGPKWIDLPGMVMASTFASTTTGGTTTYEASIGDPGLGILPVDPASKLMLRMDAPMSGEAPPAAYLPRSLTPITLVLQRSAALPPGLRFNTEGAGHAWVAGEQMKLRLTFNGNNSMKLQRLEMSSEGLSKNDTNGLKALFPKFDEKGRSYTDFVTPIADGSPVGYRALKSILVTSDNINAEMESSYRVGPVVDFELTRQILPVAPLDRSVRFSFYARSNSARPVKGELTLSVPEPLKVLNGSEHKINILSNRGKDRQTFELFFPPNTSGTFPVKFTAVLNGKKIEQTQYISVGGF